MASTIKAGLQMKGHYTLTLRRRGQVLQEVEVHNIIVDNFYVALCSAQHLFSTCALGSGSKKPDPTDTKLENLLWSAGVVQHSEEYLTSADNLTRTFILQFNFPAVPNYVGTVKEVGLYSSSSSLSTHALISDSEGNPISIEKTALDDLTVTARISVVRPGWESGQTWAFPLMFTFYNWLDINQSVSRLYCTISGNGCPDAGSTLSGAVVWGNQTGQYDANSKTCSITGSFLPTISAQTYQDYVNTLSVGSLKIWLPNKDIFPVTTLQKLKLGTGDGATTDFAPVLPYWVPDSEVVYKNGVKQQRGVDYFADPYHNTQKKKTAFMTNFFVDLPQGTKYNSATFGQPWGCLTSATCPMVSQGNPQIYKVNPNAAPTTKMNVWSIGSWYTRQNPANNKYFDSGAQLILYYSTDNAATWVELGRTNCGTSSYQWGDGQEQKLPQAVEGVTHFKVEIEGDTSSAYAYAGYAGYAGYTGEYAIRFRTPPALGDEITMDVNIDRPWKDPTTSIQWNPIIQF